MHPALLLVFSLTASIVGAVFTYVGITDGPEGLLITGWAIGALGGLGLFVALIAIAVTIGIKAART